MENRVNPDKPNRENPGQSNDDDDMNDINDESESPRQEEVKKYRYPLESESDDADDDERLNTHSGQKNPSI
ncbi:hypothetical protein DIZ81_11670 [Legionella taurinensis]|uniref:Uncharacterized protein n=1 Tax=Legionella taurinensis TaxID=70611 RepID=A0A3A5L5L8_9GAMM|nr:hypothetical protein [Legionella taurinensis]MDX1838618.1 hypothetical protein [Legionella taurinensis]PUT39054.1 hypothetical protein DB744_11680 [Legionella taurinensis]PUT41141.1 hypothetical protein DB746_10070 [Legionella taurinensis]PUT43516.1 hypothetical protein DB743_11075 [Legionella taurinensis]PUT46533.1 hypothetical protein DB745_10560 [Legionella taurinensis]